MATQSNYQLLAENLATDINDLQKRINFKKYLLEYAAGNIPQLGDDYATSAEEALSNSGKYAGLGVGAAANPSAVVANPRVVVQSLGLKGAEPFVIGKPNITGGITTKEPITRNIGFGMGFGYDDNTFKATVDFVNRYASTENTMGDAETDDPEQATYLNWRRMNSAVHNYQSQRIKDQLTRAGIFNGNVTDPYAEGLSDKYNLNLYLPRGLRKIVDDTANSILGKAGSSKGKQVNGYVRNLSRGEFNRFANTWSQNPRKNK